MTTTTYREPPTVQAAWTSNGMAWRITCPHCHCVHVHGSGAGHRLAHCEPGTPGKSLGYVLIAPPANEGRAA